MPWSSENYPDAMKNLSPSKRNKAIKIANRLLEQGKTDEDAIKIAIAQVKE